MDTSFLHCQRIVSLYSVPDPFTWLAYFFQVSSTWLLALLQSATVRFEDSFLLSLSLSILYYNPSCFILRVSLVIFTLILNPQSPLLVLIFFFLPSLSFPPPFLPTHSSWKPTVHPIECIVTLRISVSFQNAIGIRRLGGVCDCLLMARWQNTKRIIIPLYILQPVRHYIYFRAFLPDMGLGCPRVEREGCSYRYTPLL